MRWTIANIPDQVDRVGIVTGGNSGIGFETARGLALRKAHVVLACRSTAKGAEAVDRILAETPAARAEFMPLDLSSLQSVRDFAKAFTAKHDRLDLLINNAGVMMPPSRTETQNGFELQFGTNHLGHFTLTMRLLELILGTSGSRVVTVSSTAHRYGELDFDDPNWERREYKRMPSYGQSKLANLLFAFELQRRLTAAGSGTRSLAAHPGWTATNLQDESPLLRVLNPLIAMKPWQGALPTLFAATDPQAGGGDYFGPDGWFEMRGYPTRVGTSARAKSEDDASRLWQMSETLTGETAESLV